MLNDFYYNQCMRLYHLLIFHKCYFRSCLFFWIWSVWSSGQSRFVPTMSKFSLVFSTLTGYWPSNVRVCGFWFLPNEWQFSCKQCSELSRIVSSERLYTKDEMCSAHVQLEYFLKTPVSMPPIFIGLSSIGRQVLSLIGSLATSLMHSQNLLYKNMGDSGCNWIITCCSLALYINSFLCSPLYRLMHDQLVWFTEILISEFPIVHAAWDF